MKNGEETAHEQSRKTIFVDLLELLSLLSKAHELVKALPPVALELGEGRAMAVVATRLEEAALWAQAVVNVGPWPVVDGYLYPVEIFEGQQMAVLRSSGPRR